MESSWLYLVPAVALLIVYIVFKGITKYGMPWLMGAVAFMSAVFFAASTPVTWLLQRIGEFIGWLGEMLPIQVVGVSLWALIAALVLLFFTCVMLRDLVFKRSVDGGTFKALWAVPILAVVAAGPIAGMWSDVGSTVRASSGDEVSRMVGG